MNIRKKLEQETLLFDGGMGTMLHSKGLLAGEIPEIYNLTHPKVVKEIHREYAKAGADVITANTFQANPIKLPPEYDYRHIIQQGVSLAKDSGAPYVALDIGPLGQMFKPLGVFSFDDAYNIFKEQAIAGEHTGADCVVIETFSDLLEAKIAILAVKENTKLPVFCTMTFQENGRTFMGCDPITAVTTLEGLGVDAVGANCSLGPKELFEVAQQILSCSSVPVMIQPNAGLPQIVDGETKYVITPEEYSKYTLDMVKKGVKIVGGCCGTNPEFIKLVRAGLDTVVHEKPIYKKFSRISSGVKTLVFGQETIVIGERINPATNPKLKTEIQSNRLDYIIDQASDQADEGCNVISIDLGAEGTDEGSILQSAIVEIQTITRLPLQLVSADPEALEAAVRVYNGKPLIKTTSCDTEANKEILLIAKKHGTMVLISVYEEDRSSITCQQRVEITKKVLERAFELEIPKENLIIDCLSVWADDTQDQKTEIIKAIREIKQRFGVLLAISFRTEKLEQQELVVDEGFLKEALAVGVDVVTLNPSPEYMKALKTSRD